MGDAEIIKFLLLLSEKMNIEMRFKEADFLERAAARLIELPRAITRMEHPANPGMDWDGIADAFFGHKHG